LRNQIAVPVLLYHDVTDGAPADRWTVTRDALAAHLDAVLAAGLTVLTASQLAHRLSGGPDAEVPGAEVPGTGGLDAGGPEPGAGGPRSEAEAEAEAEAGASPRVCALTFDDGFASFAELAMPLLAERGLAATVYVTTGLLGEQGMLSRSAALDVFRAAGVEVGAHAIRHRHLDLLTVDEARTEIEGCRADLTELTGTAPRSFAYPHGSFTRTVRDLVRDAGYDSGYAVKNAFTHPADDRYALARLTIEADTPTARIRDWLSGTSAPLSWRRERLRTKAFRRVRAMRSGH
jgi:peptidoglycan/xylan/chitin deacetylase (PgdA/CDA1 family)